MDFESLASELSERVKEALGEAEARAREIVADAEREAAEIRERAETEARERLAEVRAAIDRLESSITGERSAVPEAAEPAEPAAAQADAAEPETVEPEPVEPNPADVAAVDEGAARLVALEMAMDGEDVEAITRRLDEEYGIANAADLAAEVHERAGSG